MHQSATTRLLHTYARCMLAGVGAGMYVVVSSRLSYRPEISKQLQRTCCDLLSCCSVLSATQRNVQDRLMIFVDVL